MSTMIIRMKKGISKPLSNQISINLMYEVAGSPALIEPFRVYITSIEVMARGMAVLKCSLKKYTAT